MQGVYDTLKGDILMGIGFKIEAANAADQFAKTWVPGEVRA